MGLKRILKAVFCGLIKTCGEDPTDSKPWAPLAPKGTAGPVEGSSQTLNTNGSSNVVAAGVSMAKRQDELKNEEEKERKMRQTLRWFKAHGINLDRSKARKRKDKATNEEKKNGNAGIEIQANGGNVRSKAPKGLRKLVREVAHYFNKHQTKVGGKRSEKDKKRASNDVDHDVAAGDRPGESPNLRQFTARGIRVVRSRTHDRHHFSDARPVLHHYNDGGMNPFEDVLAQGSENGQNETPQSNRSDASPPSCTQSLDPRALRKPSIDDPCCSFSPSPVSVRSRVVGLAPLGCLEHAWWRHSRPAEVEQGGNRGAGRRAGGHGGDEDRLANIQIPVPVEEYPPPHAEDAASVEHADEQPGERPAGRPEDDRPDDRPDDHADDRATPAPAAASPPEQTSPEAAPEAEEQRQRPPAEDEIAPEEGQAEPPAAVFGFGRLPDETTAEFDARVGRERFNDAEQFFLKNWRIDPDFDEIFALGDIIGEGAFGFVMEAHAVDVEKCMRFRFPLHVALKFINKAMVSPNRWGYDSEGRRAAAEVLLLASLDHPGIIRFVCMYDLEKYQVMVTELHGARWELQVNRTRPSPAAAAPLARGSHPRQLVAGETVVTQFLEKRRSGDLFECIDAKTHLSEATARHIMLQLLNAFFYLHFRRGIVHRDLKDENIVIDDEMNVKIIDFGSAAPMPQKREDYFRQFVGTINFAAPENALKEPYAGAPQDIWALGVILFTMLAGDNPFHGSAAIISGQLDTPWPEVSEAGHDFLNWMLTRDPEERPNAAQLLGHWWWVEPLPGAEDL